MSDDPSANGAGSPRIAVALAIADEALRRRAAQVIEDGSARFALVVDSASAAVIIADHEIEADAPAIFVGAAQAVVDAMRNGFVGGLLASFGAEKLRVAVDAAAHGMACTDAALGLAPVLEDADDGEDAEPQLTVREAEVLRQLITGASNKEIAKRLDISVHTVKFHVASIIAKLGAKSRTDAVARALRLARTMI